MTQHDTDRAMDEAQRRWDNLDDDERFAEECPECGHDPCICRSIAEAEQAEAFADYDAGRR